MTQPAKLQPATLAVHAADYDTISPAIPTVPPIHFATAYTYESVNDLDAVFEDPGAGFAYGRHGNPTVRSLETMMASLEGADATIAYASGMAAVNGVFTQYAKPGTSVIISRDVYGATLSLIRGQYAAAGVDVHIMDVTDLESVRSVAAKIKPALILAETISNPLMKVTDIAALAEIAHANGGALAIDNTFVSPALGRPLEHGADVVLHSSTKYIGGHGDVLGGVVSGSQDIIDEMRRSVIVSGAVPGPMDAWLTIRGIHTLPLRMKAHSENALAVAQWLQDDERIDKVNHAGLDTSYLAAQFLSEHRGGMVSFEVKGAKTPNVFKYMEALELIKPAPTLGDVSSLTLHPVSSSQRGFTPEERAEWGIKENLIRLSVGIEHVSDIIADLDQAISKAVS